MCNVKCNVITYVNVNGLSAPKNRQRSSGRILKIQTSDVYRETHPKHKVIKRVKIKGQKKIYYVNINQDAAKYMFFSSTYGTFTKVAHIPSHGIRFLKFPSD